GGHRPLSLGEVVGLDVPDEQAVLPREQRVIAPAGVPQRAQHVRPDRGVPPPVLAEQFGPHLEQEAVTRHDWRFPILFRGRDGLPRAYRGARPGEAGPGTRSRQKLNLSMLVRSKTVGGPSTTEGP